MNFKQLLKRLHPTRMVMLLALMLVGISASWGQKLPTAIVSLSGGVSTPFALVNTSAGKAIYGSGNQNLAYDVYSTAFTDASTGYCFVLEKPTNGTYDDNDYLLKFLTPTNQDYSVFGVSKSYLNSQPGGLAFVLGLTGSNNYTYGEDMDNGAIWTITDNGNGTYKLRNKATGKYLAGNSSNDTGDNWSFCSLGDGCEVTFSANENTWGTVSATANGEAITSGAKVAYGTQVQFTATSSSADYLTWGWKVDGSDNWNFPNPYTVTKDVAITHKFTRGYKISAVASNGEYGSVVATNGSQNGNDIRVTPWPSGGVTFKATPKSGCSLVGWYYDVNCTNQVTVATNVTIDGNNVTFASDYFNIDAEDKATVFTLWAKFAPVTHAVNFGVVNPDGNAQTSGYGTVTATVDGAEISSGDAVIEGKQVVFTANPAVGKIAWGWWKDGNRNYEGNPYTVTVGDADLTVNAVIHDGITFTAGSNNTTYGSARIECSGDRGTSFHTNPGTPGIKYVANPKTGVTFEGWYNNAECTGEAVSTATEYTLTDTNSGKTLYAKFTVPDGTYGITWSTSGKEEGCDAWFTIGDDETEYRESVFGITDGKKIYLHATDDTPKYIFAKYTIGGTEKWNNKNIDVTINGADLTISADFCPAFTYRATANVPATLKITPNDGENDINGVKQKTWDSLEKVTFSSSAESGLEFNGWYNAEGTQVSTDNPYVISSDVQKTDFTLEARYTIPAPIGGQRVKSQLTNLAKGNVPTWENGHLATDATNYNHVDVFRFSNVPDGNVNVTGTADEYTGIRFHADANTPFRVLVYINGETNPRIVTLESGNKEYTYTWAELGVPVASIANITRVCFAGQQNGSTDVTFKDVWVEKIDDSCHTFVLYGETGMNVSAPVDDKVNITYTLATPEGDATALFTDMTGGSRRGYAKEIKLENELTITAPAGKSIKAVKVITDVQATDLVFKGLNNDPNGAYSTAVTNGNEVVWTHDNVQSVTITNADASAKKANIAKIEVIYDNDNIKHPALNKNAPGQYAADLTKIITTGGFAYDAETNTVYSSSTEAYGGNIHIDFETPQDFAYLSKIIIGSDDTSIFTFCDLVPTTAEDHTQYIPVRLGSDGFTDEQKTAIAGKQIQTIIFGSNNLTKGKIKLDYIGFDISHMDPKVALDNPSEKTYTVGIGQTLNVSAHATAGEDGSGAIVWEQYDNTSAIEPMGSPAVSAQYNKTLAFTATTEGTYYFGARAYQNCKSHYDDGNDHYAFSTPEIIKVEVVKNNIYEQLLLDFDDNTYTEPGESKGRQYRIYVPQSVCNGTDADKANVPVVFSLHGTGNDNDPSVAGVQNFNELAEANKFIVVYPRGRNTFKFDVFGDVFKRGWEATGAENEDTKFFRAIIADLKGNRDEFMENSNKRFTIDESRIYFTGFSNGGMMAYAEANTSADIFAAFASISGLPMNEMHMRHHNARPVPFLHIHGTKDNFVKYTHMPTIVDNMLFRNGLAMTPSTDEGAANGGATRYKMSSYTDGEAPYIYYEIGTGSNTSDTGMDHAHQCTIGDKSSMQVIWEFFSGKTLPNSIENPFEFKARINTANNLARDHGWQTNTSSGILAQYGESGGYTSTGENVYHTIQLNGGTHSIQFTAKGTSTNYVMVKVTKLADFTTFNTMGKTVAPVTETVVINNDAYYVRDGQISIPFNGTEGEYMITITKGGKWDNTTLEDVTIVSGEVNKGVKYDQPVNTDFTGYFNYNNRLFAQWNFDLSDGYRTNVRKLEANANTSDVNRGWTAILSNTDNPSNVKNGTIVFVNNQPIGTQIDDSNYNTDLTTYHELTYNCSYTEEGPNDIIAIAAGLKFKAPKESLKLYVDIANGQVSGAHLVVNENVKMYIPYVENSYRNDKNEFTQPQDHKDDFKNCMHHINRDILYIALNQGSIWDEWNNDNFISQGHVKNKCIDLDEDLFRNGGDEFVNGKNYNKADYMGKNGTPCIVQFNRETNIDRIGVNRNLIYSFYTEYINELGKTKPTTRFRVVGNPQGQKIANDGSTTTEYTGAIAMTYGGWMNSEGGSSYTKWDNSATTDAWSDLGVVNYDPDNSAIHFNTWANMKPSQAGTNSLPAIDGFPVVALLDTEARSGSLLPSSLAPQVAKTENDVDYVAKTVKDEETGQDKTVYIPNYMPQCEGKYMVPTQSNPYKANVTPWSLPSRGGYAKFEPSIPGVLNMNVIQNGGHNYYIADEFGKLVDQSTIFSTTGSKQTIDKSNGCYKIANTDYVKHVLNVEPGKTYYIFSNTTGLGIAGFYFEPYVNHDGTERGRFYVGVNEEAYKLKAGVAYALPADVNRTETITSPDGGSGKNYEIHYSQKAVKVNLRRAFNANQWETICLPYSMNQVQMEQVFGPGTRVVLLRDVQDKEHSVDNKTTMTLICHENQDIIAGYPYLIRPTQAVPNGVETISSLPTTAPTPLIINSEGPNTNSHDAKTYGGMNNWDFTGHYGGTADVANGSYVVKDGKLCQVKNADGKSTTISGYRAWMENKNPQNLARIARFVGADGEVDEDATAIDEINIDQMLEQQGIFTKKANVYSINGQMVRQNADNLNDLPKGIYIVNGKKYIIK